MCAGRIHRLQLNRDIQRFDIEALFGSEDAAAMFGRFTYKSAVLSKVVTSPFAAFARIAKGPPRFAGSSGATPAAETSRSEAGLNRRTAACFFGLYRVFIACFAGT